MKEAPPAWDEAVLRTFPGLAQGGEELVYLRLAVVADGVGEVLEGDLDGVGNLGCPDGGDAPLGAEVGRTRLGRELGEDDLLSDDGNGRNRRTV